MQRTDETLMIAHRSGEAEAFGELMRRYSAPLLGFLVRMTGDRQESEDHFQETFIRVHDKAESFDETGIFKPWLYTIATRVAMDSHRKKRRRPTLDSALNKTLVENPAPAQPTPGDRIVRAELRDQVQAAIADLPSQQRAVLVLSYYEGLPYRRIAEILDCSEGTVKTHMSRAIRKLAVSLPEE
jgi:RNA polymerase sigma-70 factor (ECF subfamily)